MAQTFLAFASKNWWKRWHTIIPRFSSSRTSLSYYSYSARLCASGTHRRILMQNRALCYIIRVWWRLNVMTRMYTHKAATGWCARDAGYHFAHIALSRIRLCSGHRRIFQGHEATGTWTLRSTDIALYRPYIHILHLKRRLSQTFIKKKNMINPAVRPAFILL